MPHNNDQKYLEKFNLHKQQAESYKSQHSFDAALEEYIEAMEQLKAARLENKNRSNILYIFQSESFDDQNTTAIKLGIAECYLEKDDLENAHRHLHKYNLII